MGNITLELYYGEIVEFPICYKCGRETDSVNDYLYCPECESKEENK